jgi:hypothetical protein
MKMKKWILLALSFSVLVPSQVRAGRAAPFKGIYDILSQQDRSATQAIFLLDNDTLGSIWAKYAEGPLPADLEQYRNEQAIIAGFNNRDLLFFGLEKGALIADGFLALQGGDGERLELNRRSDGQYDMAVKEKGRITIYLLAAPRALPESTRNSLLPGLKID